MIRTVNPKYLLPSKEEMRAAAEESGVKSFSSDFVADMCNLLSGGRMMTSPEFQQSLPKLKRRDKETLKEFNSRQTCFENEAFKSYHAVKQFMQDVDLKAFPGKSPLKKAMSLLASMQDGGEDSQEGADGTDTLPIAVKEGKGKSIQQNKEDWENLSDPKKEILGYNNEGDGDNPDKLPKLDSNFLKKFMEISRLLDKTTKMKAHKSNKIVADRSGSRTRLRNLQSPSEVVSSTPDLFAMEDFMFNYKVGTRQAMIREKVNHEQKQQLLYLMIDSSGSMGNDERRAMSLAVLQNRIEQVLSGDAKLIVAWFNDGLSDETIVDTPSAASDYVNRLREGNLPGGGTRIGACLKEAVSRIEDKLKDEFSCCDRPEICVVTDEDGSCDISKDDLHKCKVHGFTVTRENKPLEKLVLSSGGFFYSLG